MVDNSPGQGRDVTPRRPMRPQGSDARKIRLLVNGAKHGMFEELEHVVRILSEIVLRGRRDLADPG
jgi:hypothetical protein